MTEMPLSPIFWRFEIDTHTLIPSARCRALHGLAANASFSYAEYLAAIHPDDRAAHRQALEQAINETGRFDAKYRIIWPDGSVHRVHTIGTVSPPAVGAPPQIVGASIELAE